MDDTNDTRRDNADAIQRAADSLADRFKSLAEDLASRTSARQVPYGQGRVGQLFPRKSPQGFVLDAVSLQMLLPDGRLWKFSRSEASRLPSGRFFDPRVDHPSTGGGRSSPGGREFVFLGAAVGKYSFGWSPAGSGDGESGSDGLVAIVGEGASVRYVTADDAFAAIAEITAELNESTAQR